MTMAADTSTLARIRMMLALIVVLGCAGIAAELLFQGHFEEWRQSVPLVTIGFAILSFVAAASRPGAGTIRLLQAAMLLMMASGALGVWFHYHGNRQFQVEMDPSAHGLDLLLKVLNAKAPPALAPGVMVQLGLLGLVYTYGHPSRKRHTGA